MANFSKVVVFIFFFSVIISCNSCTEHVRQTEETKKIVAELKQLVADGNPMGYYHWNGKMAEALYQQIATAPPEQKDQIWFQYCLQLVFSGDNKKGISELEARILPLNAEDIKPSNQGWYELLGVAYLRLGEVENCQQAHNEHSCILPLKKEAFHELKTGSQKALEIFTLIHNKFPSERYVWLQNLAAMTLGTYPEAVPANSKIVFPNWKLEQKNFPPFKEVAMNVGVAHNGLSGGTCIDDFNGDGLLDIFVTSYGMMDNVKLYLNNGKGGFDDKTNEAGLNGITSGLNCIHADFDNDGDNDIFILRGAWLGAAGIHPNSLLRNNGKGGFDDVTRSAGLLSYHPTQTASWGDFNKDGLLDLFVGNESQGTDHRSELFRNNGDGTFTDVAAEVGLGNLFQFVKGAIWGDINNDSWPDLYISVLGGKNILLKNRQGRFENIALNAGVEEPYFSFPCWFWDVNNDGFEDIFVSGYDSRFLPEVGGDYVRELTGSNFTSERPRLFINNKDETFSEQSAAYGVNKTMYSMGSNFGDLDNDGFLDFYIGTGSPDFTSVVPNRMFRSDKGKRFEEVTSAGRFGHIQKGHGVAFADIDNDGDQDIYAVLGGAFEGDVFTNVLFENPISKNNWITVELVGVKSNKGGVGSILELVLNNGQKIFRTVNTGGTFGSASLQQEIGLSAANTINELIVHWQNSEPQVFKNVAGNRKVRLTEGRAEIEQVELAVIPFAKSVGKHHHH